MDHLTMGLALILFLLFTACTAARQDEFDFQGEIPMEGKLIYTR